MARIKKKYILHKMKKDINNIKKGKYHGYQEWYHKNALWNRCNYKNNLPINYAEWHGSKNTIYYIT